LTFGFCLVIIIKNMTNLTKTKEEISIIVIFTSQGPKPYQFKWAGKDFKVEKINLVFEKKLGNDKLIYFSVTAEDNYFKLCFNTNTLKWYVEEIYHQ